MNRLQTRFIMAGALLVLTTVGSGLWSAWTFSRLSVVVGEKLKESHETAETAAGLASSLEREDDALLLAVNRNLDRAKQDLARERRHGDELYQRLLPLFHSDIEQNLSSTLRAEMDAYRKAGDALVATWQQPDALDRYHQQVNPGSSD